MNYFLFFLPLRFSSFSLKILWFEFLLFLLFFCGFLYLTLFFWIHFFLTYLLNNFSFSSYNFFFLSSSTLSFYFFFIFSFFISYLLSFLSCIFSPPPPPTTTTTTHCSLFPFICFFYLFDLLFILHFLCSFSLLFIFLYSSHNFLFFIFFFLLPNSNFLLPLYQFIKFSLYLSCAQMFLIPFLKSITHTLTTFQSDTNFFGFMKMLTQKFKSLPHKCLISSYFLN